MRTTDEGTFSCKKIHPIRTVAISASANSLSFPLCFFDGGHGWPTAVRALRLLGGLSQWLGQKSTLVVVVDFVRSPSGDVAPIYTPTRDAASPTEHAN